MVYGSTTTDVISGINKKKQISKSGGKMKKSILFIIIGLGIIVFIGIIGAFLAAQTTQPQENQSTEVNYDYVAQTVMSAIQMTNQAIVAVVETVVTVDTVEPTQAYTETPSVPSFVDGTWIVGVDIPAGTYKTDGSDTCYWERLSGFGGTFDEIIANDNPDGQVVVTILPIDKGFVSKRCGIWTLISY